MSKNLFYFDGSSKVDGKYVSVLGVVGVIREVLEFVMFVSLVFMVFFFSKSILILF